MWSDRVSVSFGGETVTDLISSLRSTLSLKRFDDRGKKIRRIVRALPFVATKFIHCQFSEHAPGS